MNTFPRSTASSRFRPVYALAFALPIVAIACTTNTSGNPEQDDPNATGQVESAVGEPGCGAVQLTSTSIGEKRDLTQETDTTPGCTLKDYVASDFTPISYGSSSCPSQFVMEVDNTLNIPYAATAQVIPHANLGYFFSDPTACAAVGATIALYGQKPGSSKFNLAGQETLGGTWVNGSCEMAYVSGSGTLSFLANTYQAVRLAGEAYSTTVTKGVPTTTQGVAFLRLMATPSCH
jgi:hypothetical protein